MAGLEPAPSEGTVALRHRRKLFVSGHASVMPQPSLTLLSFRGLAAGEFATTVYGGCSG